MTIPSPRLGLAKPTDDDPFSTEEIAANWQIIDDSPGIRIVENRALVTGWGSIHEGMLVYERSTDLIWRWTGTTWTRAFPSGWIAGSARTTTVTTTTTSQTAPATAVSTVAAIPQGGRQIMVVATWFECESTGGRSVLSIWRDTAQIDQWTIFSDTDVGTQGFGGSKICFDLPPAGNHTYAFKLRCSPVAPGTVSLRAEPSASVDIGVIEI